MHKKHPFRKKIICSAFTGVIAASCLTAVPASADTIFKGYFESLPGSHRTETNTRPVCACSAYDINKDGKINVFDAILMRNFLTNSRIHTPDKLKRNQILEDAKNTVEQYIKTNNSALVSSLNHISVTGFNVTSSPYDLDDNFLAVAAFNRPLTEEELTGICKNEDTSTNEMIARDLIMKKTEYRYLRVSVINGAVDTIIPSENGDMPTNKEVTSSKPSYSTYDINKNGSIDVTDLVCLQTFLNSGDTIAAAEKKNAETVKNVTATVRQYIDDIAPDACPCDIQIEALTDESGVAKNDFLVTVTFDFSGPYSLDDMKNLCKGDSTYFDNEYLYEDIRDYFEYYKVLRFTVIDGVIDTVVPVDVHDPLYYTETAVANSYSGNLMTLNNKEYSAIYIAEEVRKTIKEKSDIMYAKIVDITNNPDSSDYMLDTIITFDAPLTFNELVALKGPGVSVGTADILAGYQNKTSQVKVLDNNGSYTFLPILPE